MKDGTRLSADSKPGFAIRLSRSTTPCEQIMRAEHDPIGLAGLDRLARQSRPGHIRSSRARCAVCSTRADNERSGVISEVNGFLELYRDPVIAANTAVSDFRIDGSDESPTAGFALHRGSARPQEQPAGR